MPPRLVLCPSPILARGRFFEPLASALRGAGLAVTVLNLPPRASNLELTTSLAQQFHRAAGDDPVTLIPYSGAGPLAPAVVRGFAPGQASVLFLDATLPHPARARLDELREALPPEAFDALQGNLDAGRAWPEWTDDDLAPLVTDPAIRSEILGMMSPQPLSFFAEPLSADELPADVRCGYFRLSGAYDSALAFAATHGWPTRSLDLTHFGPYTHPVEVARGIVSLLAELRPGAEGLRAN